MNQCHVISNIKCKKLNSGVIIQELCQVLKYYVQQAVLVLANFFNFIES